MSLDELAPTGAGTPSFAQRDQLVGYLTNEPPVARRIRLSTPGLDPTPKWVTAVERGLNNLAGLEAGWDGGRAQPITLPAVQALVTALSRITASDSLAPQLFPLADGGVQAEWLVDGTGVEIEATADGEVLVLAVDKAGEVLAEGTFTPAGPLLEQLRAILERMTTRVATVG